eukprot:3349372-Alexandrium_andersonii.AAC.1
MSASLVGSEMCIRDRNPSWHSAVVSDSTLYCVRSKSDQRHAKYFSFAQAALEEMKNEPTIIAHWGA